ncbi:MAG TPA: shikimate dehydrogenase, partial [Devosia sp.]|nr:shikimate dehydrogenase [Devosia sp.]
FDRLRAGEFAGGNVTIPHKEAVFALCDSVDPLARRIGAVNTLVVKDGQVRGSNTDYLGFLGNLDAGAPGWDAGPKSAIVLGAGGAARAVLVALQSRGIQTITLLNRTQASAQKLATQFGSAIEVAPLDAFDSHAPHADLVVNTTSIGMHGTSFAAMDLGKLPETALVTDLVYVPMRTPLLAAAVARGLRTVDGLGMLLHQAVPGFEAWFGIRPTVTPALRARLLATLEP